MTTSPERLAAEVAAIRAQRADAAPIDVAVDGISSVGNRRLVQEYAQAGATWWLEAIFTLARSHRQPRSARRRESRGV